MFIVMDPAYLITTVLFLASCGYVVFSSLSTHGNTGVKARHIFNLTSILLIFYSFCYALMTIAVNEQLRFIFWAVGFGSGLMFFPVWLWFLVHMVPPKKKIITYLTQASILVAGVLMFLCILSEDVVFRATDLGYQFSYGNSLIFKIALYFTFFLSLPLIMLQFKWWSEAELTSYRRLSRIFALVAPLVSSIGFITDFIVPIFTSYTIIPFGPVSILLGSLTTYFVLISSQSQSITVRNVSGFTFSSIMMPILVLDRKNNVGLENKAAIEFFGKSVIEGNIASHIMLDGKPPIQSFFKDSFRNELITVTTPLGIRTCEMMLTVERDKLGDTLFKVAIIRDKTETFYMDSLLDKALTDELTGARTRRYFVEIAEEELIECINSNKQFSVIMIDADHFKDINDTYGHPVGDEVLRILVSRIRNTLKADTLLARYGGEEFVISLPDISREDAISTAERIRVSIESDTFMIENIEINVTISLGVASLAFDAATISNIIGNADKALYRAKQTGRNKVVYIDELR